MNAKQELVRSWLIKAQHDLAAARKLSAEPDPYLIEHDFPLEQLTPLAWREADTKRAIARALTRIQRRSAGITQLLPRSENYGILIQT